MKLPPVNLLSKEDLGDDVPDWTDNLIYPINLFMTSVYNGLNRQITQENLKVQIKTFTIIGSSTPTNNTYAFTTDYQITPEGVELYKIERTDNASLIFSSAPFVSWNYRNGTFNVLAITSLSDGVSYNVTLKLSYS